MAVGVALDCTGVLLKFGILLGLGVNVSVFAGGIVVAVGISVGGLPSGTY